MAVYSPTDTLIGPIVHALAQIATNQITGITTVYEQSPDGPPEDGSVLLPLTSYKVLDDTNGRLYLELVFGVRYLVRRSSFIENISTAYSYVVPFLQAYSEWENLTLGGLVQEISIKVGGVTQTIMSGQAFVALIVNISVKTEFNILTTS